MKTNVYMIKLKNDPEVIRKYKEYHGAVWPEIVEGTRRAGIRRSRIYILGNTLVMVVDAEDNFKPVMNADPATASPREKEWDDLMRTFQVPVPEAKEGEWWAKMDLVLDQITE
jgi:L-rhamnose mutarotase